MAVTGYKLRYRNITDSGGYTVVDVGDVLTRDVTGLTASKQYGFQVASYDAAGNQSDEWSTEWTATTGAVASNLALASAGATIAADVEDLGAGTSVRLIDGSRNAQGSFNSTGGFQQNGDGHTVTITFAASSTITEVDVIFADDADLDGTTDPPDQTHTSTLAAPDYKFEYWDGAAWQTIVNITGNNKQWRKHTFAGVTTTKIRYTTVTAASGAFYGLELEAWGVAGSGGGGGGLTNVALASAGATITADVEDLGSGTRSRLIDGSRNSGGSFNSTGGFQQNGSPHTVEITFSGTRTISEVDLIFADDADQNSTTNPTLSSPGVVYAVQDYTVDYWNGSAYVNLITVTANDKQWRQHTVTPTATTKLKFTWNTVRSGAAYVLELEAWE